MILLKVVSGWMTLVPRFVNVHAFFGQFRAQNTSLVLPAPARGGFLKREGVAYSRLAYSLLAGSRTQ